jgi:hypothetical protein
MYLEVPGLFEPTSLTGFKKKVPEKGTLYPTFSMANVYTLTRHLSRVLLLALGLMFASLPQTADAAEQARAVDSALGMRLAARSSMDAIDRIRAVVDAAFMAGKWGNGFDLSSGEKPVLVNISSTGLFLFGTANPCLWIEASWDWIVNTTPFDNLGKVTPSSCEEYAPVVARLHSFGFLKSDQTFSASKSVSSARLFNIRSDRDFSASQSNLVRLIGRSGFDRVLEVSLQRLDEHNLRELGRLIVHEGAHLFGQDALTMPLYGACRDPNDSTSKNCRAQLLVESQNDHPGNEADRASRVSREVCASAELVRCLYGDSCRHADGHSIQTEGLSLAAKRVLVSATLEQIVTSIEERTLGRSQTIESFWYLLEGVPTYLEISFLKKEGFISLIDSQCIRHQVKSRRTTDLHHLYVGAALIAGFKFCISTPGRVEQVASFSKEGIWSRSGHPWFSTLIGNVRETNCS